MMPLDAAAASAPSGAWTCPFCPLHCDDLAPPPASEAGPWAECPRAAAGLAAWQAVAAGPAPQPLVDGRPVPLGRAVATAAGWLGAARQPLLAGLGCDVDGARALYPVAAALGAITDTAGGEGPWQALRALQDRGQFTTTLAEVRTRADVIVFIGGLPDALAPRYARRLGLGDLQVPHRHLVLLRSGGPVADQAADDAALARLATLPGISTELISLPGDLFDAMALLQSALAAPWLPGLPPALVALAQRLQQAQYAVLLGAPAQLPAQGGLVIEAVHRVVGQLNHTRRAAALWLSGGNGVATANQVFTWLSGLPARTRVAPRGLEHEPQLFGARRLLEDQAVDALLWVSAFEADSPPPREADALGVPTVVLGHPGLAAACSRAGQVFIPVAPPGLAAAGHVFRTDGTVLVPLWPLPQPPGSAAAALPTLAEVARLLRQALPSAAHAPIIPSEAA